MTSESRMICPKCSVPMNQHAEKVVMSTGNEPLDAVFGGTIQEMHTCPQCGGSASRKASA